MNNVFSYWDDVHLVIHTMASIVGINDHHIFYSGNSVTIPGYPYIAFNIPTPHHTVQRHPTYEYEIFENTINCNFYDKSPQWPADSCSTLHYALRDPVNTRLFHQHGIVIAAVSDNGSGNSDIANMNDIYSQNLQIKMRFNVYHHSTIENVKNTNLSKHK